MLHFLFQISNQVLQHFWLVVLVLCLSLTPFKSAVAVPDTYSGDLLRQPTINIPLSLSNDANELKFFPNHLELVAGKRYKLLLTNPSSQKHYFTAKDFADVIWTQKVEAGRVEVKGAIKELELKPKAEAEWVFIPIKQGTYTVRCPIPGHTEAGMKGEIVIVA